MTIQIIKATNKVYNGVYKEIYNQVNIKSVPFLIILFLTFMILFGCTNITISAADNLSYPLLVLLLAIVQIFFYFFLHNKNYYNIYIILTSILMTFALLYVIYIKRIYDKEMEITIELKDKDIIDDVNISCWD
jgi:uncharacterized protein involved in response to NO